MISSDGAGRRAIGRALCDTFGIDSSNMNVRMSGKTDPQILSEIFKAANVVEADMEHKKEEMFRVYLTLLQEEIKKAAYYIVHPGVYELLDALERHDRGYLGLLTGNIELGARMKLEQFDLNKYFPLGAYGSDSANRMELPEIATQRARKHFDVPFSNEQVVIIGDSIYDVLCAKGYGAKSIAVNTGVTPKADLEEQQPDFLFDNLSDTTAVMNAIFA
jgi:phosphoglycolate phosphatase-like HAD superfamily hydrolase